MTKINRMTKLLFIICLLTVSVMASAQFEQGKWVFNPSITGLDLSYSKSEKATFGFEYLGGAFIVDNIALLVNLGASWANAGDMYAAGVGGRYYFESTGIYLGGGLRFKRLDNKGSKNITDFAVCPEAGYAFFIGRNITLEPAVYYDLSLKERDYSKIGLKLGFGVYF